MNTLARAACLLAAALLLTACNDDDNPAPPPVTYTVTATGLHMTISPGTPQVVNPGDTLDLSVVTELGYVLDATVAGTCPAGSFSGIVYTTGAITADCTVAFSASPNVASLALSTSLMALSVTGGTATGAPTGAARTLTVTNTSTNSAAGMGFILPLLPPGTTASNTCTTGLAPGASCTLTITPGATATSDGTNPCTVGTAPVPQTITLRAANAPDVLSSVVVLGYGCIWQGGYVFALDDSTPTSGNVGGKVAATVDQAPAYPNGLIWSSDGGGSVILADIAGTDETDTSPCVGARDGACNTLQIADYHETAAPGAPVNLAYYAAGQCKATIAGHSDWYLPAACEMGYGGAGCGTAGAPTLDNLQSNLVDRNGLNLLSGFYWSSTEVAAQPAQSAFAYYFDAGGGATTSSAQKDNHLGARCARVVIP